MTDSSQHPTPQESPDRYRERAAYQPPTLRRLGSVRELTLSGGASNGDGTGLAAAKGGAR